MATQRDQPTSRLRSQAKLVFGGALATGLQVGLVQCVMLQRWSPLLGALLGSAVYGVATLWHWQWVVPRITSPPRVQTLLLQATIATAVIIATSFVLVNLMIFSTKGGWMFSPYTGGDVTVLVPATWLAKLPELYFAVPIVPVVLLAVVGFTRAGGRSSCSRSASTGARARLAAQLEALRARINPHFSSTA